MSMILLRLKSSTHLPPDTGRALYYMFAYLYKLKLFPHS